MSILLLRHGDRQDYADPKGWARQAEASGGNVRDPPLSRLGRKQALEAANRVAQLLASCNVDKQDVVILASPYVALFAACVGRK